MAKNGLSACDVITYATGTRAVAGGASPAATNASCSNVSDV